MKYKVTAQAYERDTFQKAGKEREEIIDTETNSLFDKVMDDPFQIRQRYEHFWNDLNWSHSKRKVFVIAVTKVT